MPAPRGDHHAPAPSNQGTLIWKDKKELGRGGFGVVYRVPWRDARGRESYRAVKITGKTASADNEWRSLESLGYHKNIVQYYGHSSEIDQIIIELEYVDGGDLTSYMFANFFNRSKSMPSAAARDLTYQTLEGLYYIHSKGYIHRDIKPDNIMLTTNRVVKIADFGLAAYVGPNGWKSGASGTLKYLGPEVFTDRIQGFPTDMWAIGVTVFQMLFKGHFPFQVVDEKAIVRKAQQLKGKNYREAALRMTREHYSKILWPTNTNPWAGTHKTAYEFIARLLTVDHSRRLTCRNALSDPWFRTAALAPRSRDGPQPMFIPRGTLRENTGVQGLDAAKNVRENALSKISNFL